MDFITGDPSERAVACVILFALWGIVLVLAVGAWRVSEVVGGGKRANAFPSGTQHGSDAYWRLNRAHMNVVENLAIFGAIVIGLAVLGLDTPLFAQLAQVILIARVIQSIVHISSGSALAVNFRFLAYVVQIACCIWLIIHGFRVLGVVRF